MRTIRLHLWLQNKVLVAEQDIAINENALIGKTLKEQS